MPFYWAHLAPFDNPSFVIGRTIKEFFNKNQDLTDIRNGVVGAIAINEIYLVLSKCRSMTLASFVKQQLDNKLI